MYIIVDASRNFIVEYNMRYNLYILVNSQRLGTSSEIYVGEKDHAFHSQNFVTQDSQKDALEKFSNKRETMEGAYKNLIKILNDSLLRHLFRHLHLLLKYIA